MLELRNIRKSYITGSDKVEALKGIDLKFRESEFVSILGQSGCGKTTLLNIIGGLDRYSSGDLIINGKSTKNFKDRDWDAYRNYKIGFVFQSYNLIGHQTVLSNVELALTIGGISKVERRLRAISALEEVGLKEHMYKRPNQLSGGQMQRVAIARALVNDPDIILADEPTGALDTKTSVQVMEILKKISKNKLIIMVTHNPELAEEYSSRIIRILDGLIIEDSNPIIEDEKQRKIELDKMHRTSMSFWTAFRLSLNNLLTKKGRTILIAFAGSIGIIGIALVQAISNGFQGYIDHIQEETLTSYPLSIMQEATDLTSALLAMTSNGDGDRESDNVKEEQYMSKVLDSLSTNDLRSFKEYIKNNYNDIKNDVSLINNTYSIDPLIYTINHSEKLVKLNPNNLFSSTFGMSSSIMMSSFSSVFSQMMDDREVLDNSYEVLAGHWPENYNEMVIVLSEAGTIPDLLVYSLGFRDTSELSGIISKIMSGEAIKLDNEPMNFTYQELMDADLRLLMPTDLYKYNEEYEVYEDMSGDDNYIKDLYNDALQLKIVGVVTTKEGVTSSALMPGISYKSELIEYIIDYAAEREMVKKQIENQEVDVLSGARFDEKKNGIGLNFADLVSVDTGKLQSAFNINITPEKLQEQAEGYMAEMMEAINADTTGAASDFRNTLNKMSYGVLNGVSKDTPITEVDSIVNNYLETSEATSMLVSLEEKYGIPRNTFKTAYSGLLKGLVSIYIAANSVVIENSDEVNSAISNRIDNFISNLPEGMGNIATNIKDSITNSQQESNMANAVSKDTIIASYMKSVAIQETINTMARAMTEATLRKTVMIKIGELMEGLTNSLASAFEVDQNKISSSFKMKITEEEITRIITAMLNKTESNAKTNLVSFGYQDKEEPTYMSFYFRSFDGKERFKDFIKTYNNKVKANGEEEKEINYTDTTGILMGSVSTIVDAVTYVLIAFISISLVVSSIMIGIITYISVYERTKEIGILRAIGASKRNISSIFNAETFIIGLLSGGFGIGVTYLLIPIINAVLHHFTGNIPLNATFYWNNAMVLVILSVALTIIGGLIPAKAASKKDPVIALRTE